MGTYTSKLNSVDTRGVVRQAGYMMAGAAGGLALYLLFLRPHFGVSISDIEKTGSKAEAFFMRSLQRQIAPKAKQLFIKLIHKTGGSIPTNPTSSEKGNLSEQDEIHSTGEKRTYAGRIQRGAAEFWDILIMSEDYHLMDCGLDSVAYLRLVWMSASIFAVVSFFTFTPLVTLDWKAHHPDKIWSIDTFSQAQLDDFTIQKVTGATLFYHMAAMYVITFIVFVIMWWSMSRSGSPPLESIGIAEDLLHRLPSDVQVSVQSRSDAELTNIFPNAVFELSFSLTRITFICQ